MYSIPAILTVALGIGANTAMFSVLHDVAIRPLPYPEANALVRVFPTDPARGDFTGSLSLPDVRDWEERTTRLSALGAYATLAGGLVYTGGEEAVETTTAYVTAGFYEAMRTAPLLGRLPTADDERTDDRVVALSHSFWRRNFDADPGTAGATIQLNGEPYRVAGIMPSSFAFPDREVEVWAFLSVIPASSIPFQYRGVRLLDAVGRLAPGVSAEEARQELTSIAAGLAETYPGSNGRVPAAGVQSLHETVVGDVRGALAILMAAALVILVVVCANVANLALAREVGRQGELAVRTAMGASRSRLVGIVVTESLLVSLVGGVLGLLLASWGTQVLSAVAVDLLPRAGEIGLSWPVALFSLAASIVTGVTFGLLPGLRAGRVGAAGVLRGSGRSLTGRGRNGLVVAQVASAVVLVVGAGLLTRSLLLLKEVDVGFEPEGVVVADMTFLSTRFPDRTDYLARFDETLAALERVPGVSAVGSIRHFPFFGRGENISWSVPGRAPTSDDGDEAWYLQVTGRAFEALGVQVTEGQPLARDAGLDGRPVVVVNEALARIAFGGGQAVGSTIVLGDESFEVVGVVADIRQSRVDASAEPTVYVPNRLLPRRAASFVVRVGGDRGAALAGVQAAIRDLDRNQAIKVLAPAIDLVGGQLSRPRLFTGLLGLLALLALSLSAVGVYGVVAFGVAQRHREVGVRMALGATGEHVQGLIMRQGMTPVVTGIVLGFGAALLMVRAVSGLLYGVDRFDPLSYGVAVTTLLVVGSVACWLPGRSASRTAPSSALSSE